MVVSEPTKSGPAKKGAPLTVEGIGWVVVSEGTKLGPAKKGAPLTVGASSSAKTEAKRAVKAMVEYFIASGMESKDTEHTAVYIGERASEKSPFGSPFGSLSANFNL